MPTWLTNVPSRKHTQTTTQQTTRNKQPINKQPTNNKSTNQNKSTSYKEKQEAPIQKQSVICLKLKFYLIQNKKKKVEVLFYI